MVEMGNVLTPEISQPVDQSVDTTNIHDGVHSIEI